MFLNFGGNILIVILMIILVKLFFVWVVEYIVV